MVKYLIFGKGYLGNKFAQYFKDSVISDQRINSSSDAEKEITKHNPEVVINCIGRTGTPNVDWCEDHKIETMKGNVTVPLMILEACQSTGKYMVHIGSGCIYNGDNGGKGWTEEDEPNFFGSFYSRTKIYSEKMLKEFPVLQLRIRIPMDDIPHSKNIIDKIIKFEKVIDVDNSITYLPDLMKISEQLIKLRKTGVYNAVNKGPLRYPYLLDKYKELVDPNKTYETFSLEDLHSEVKAKRSNCVLSVSKLEKAGIKVRPIQEAVVDCLKKYRINLKK